MTNPFFEPWTAPFGAPPLDRIRPEHFPAAYDKALARPVTLDQRINLCRANHQQAAPLPYESRDILALSDFVAHQSRGVAITAGDDPRLDDHDEEHHDHGRVGDPLPMCEAMSSRVPRPPDGQGSCGDRLPTPAKSQKTHI